MEVGDWDVAGPRSPMDADDSFKRYKGDVHVRRVGGDAMLAAAEDSLRAVDARDRAAARARLALVAGHGDVPEIHAAGALKQVSACRRLVAQLGRCPG